jgi:hypothetical protein
MNISSQLTSSPLATVTNLPTESLRRDNNQRELIAKPEAAAQSAAEKGVASEKERARASAQNHEQIDFASIRKRAEQANTTISGDSDQGSESKEQQQEPPQTSSEKSAAKVFIEEKIINELPASPAVIGIKPNNIFVQEKGATSTGGHEFDRLINHTLAAQEMLSPSRSHDVTERAVRIEKFYHNINQANERRPSYQFELTV